jgi:hypothetical protein
MADAEDSKSSARKGVRVRIPPPAPLRIKHLRRNPQNRFWGFLFHVTLLSHQKSASHNI